MAESLLTCLILNRQSNSSTGTTCTFLSSNCLHQYTGVTPLGERLFCGALTILSFDSFSKRADREGLLRSFARIVNVHMQKMGIKAFGFICHKIDSKEALDAYRVFAEELEGIAGMLAVQYSPYNGGYGKVFWVKDRKGNDIPVISARGQIWA